MYAVNYHRASSVAEAAELLQNGEAKLLSGGMTLIPAMKTRLAAPSAVSRQVCCCAVDLRRVPGASRFSGPENRFGASRA